MLTKVLHLSRRALLPVALRSISKEMTQALIEEVKPQKTPFHINEDGPDFPQFDHSKYGRWLPKPQDLVSQCLIPPDQSYIYQEIEPFTLKVLNERKRKRAQQFFLDLPYDVHGLDQIPLIQDKQFISQFMRRNGISRLKLKDHLRAQLEKCLALIAQKDVSEAKYSSLFQTQMGQKMKERKEELREEQIELKWQGEGGFDLQIQNSVFVKGVHGDRTDNGTNFDYIIEQAQEERGLHEYIHKYFMGDNLIYPINALGSPNLKKFQSALEVQHFLEQTSQKILWKIVALVRMKGTRLEAWKSNKKLQISDESDLHLVVFENELKTPPHITLCDLEFQDWMYEHRYYPWNWRVADFDFYMKGNPYYSARVDLRKMESLKPEIKKLPDFLEQSISQIYGIKSIHAAQPTYYYAPNKIYSVDENAEDEEGEEEEEIEKNEEEDPRVVWRDIGPSAHRKFKLKPWIPYVSDNVYEH